MGWFRNMVMKLLRINPAPNNQIITINEPYSYETNVLRNRLWYRGDPSELDQFYKQAATDPVARSRFWAMVPTDKLSIRKIHSGLPSMIAEKLSDIVVADLDGIELETEEQTEQWVAIGEDNKFDELLASTIVETLVAGDGAFKITIDTDVTDVPIIEFFSGERVQYRRARGRLQEVLFYTDYTHDDKDYQLEEIFGRGYIHSKLYDDEGKEVPLTSIPETMDILPEITYQGDFIMAVPLKFFKSPKWTGRGKSLYETKTDSFDALDEVISQWIDAIRLGRVTKYIPEDMIPRNPHTGELIEPNPFDNQYISLKSALIEDDKGQISVVQPPILYQAFVESYANTLDMCLQGIISPATLGIDLKKTDNAEAQREKEKTTLYTRGKIIETLNEVIPRLVDIVLKVNDTFHDRTPQEYVASIGFGEYASPDFDTVVETVGKAKTYGIMSIEQAIQEMYGDTWTEEEKQEEINRIKAEQGDTEMDEPQVGEYDDFEDEEE